MRPPLHQPHRSNRSRPSHACRSAVALAAAAMLVSGCQVQSPIEAFKREEIPFPPTVRRPEPPPPPAAPVRAQWQRIGTSIRGRPIEAAQFEAGSVGGGGERRIYIIGGMRGDEPEAPRAAQRMADLLAAEGIAPESPLAGATIRIVRDMNPDGTGRSTRTNTRGVDLTRNWPSSCFQEEPRQGGGGRAPASELETAAVHRDMQAFRPDVVIVLSSSTRGPRVMFADALAVPREPGDSVPAAPAAAQARPGTARPAGQAGRPAAPSGRPAPVLAGPRMVVDFASGARRQDPRWRAVPERSIVGTGTVEALVAGDWGKPVLTIEFQRGRDESINARALVAGLETVLAPAR
jgi:hypothetical protein